jgi:hypothetical protein
MISAQAQTGQSVSVSFAIFIGAERDVRRSRTSLRIAILQEVK